MLPDERLLTLRAELESAGLVHGLDFFVVGLGTSVSSEFYGLHLLGTGECTVYYRDMGRTREELRTSDFGAAADFFRQRVYELAGGRGRGPLGDPSRRPLKLRDLQESRRRAQEQ